MNLYKVLKDKQQARMDDFLYQYAFFAFSNEQFDRGLAKLGVAETDAEEKIRSFGSGGFVLATKAKDLMQIVNQSVEEQAQAVADPETGKQFAFDMFYYELLNHEFQLTMNSAETLQALGYTWNDLKKNPVLNEALRLAQAKIIEDGYE